MEIPATGNLDGRELSDEDRWIHARPPLIDGFDFDGLPEEFFALHEQDDFDFAPRYSDDCEPLLDLARELWGSMQRGFASALRNKFSQGVWPLALDKR